MNSLEYEGVTVYLPHLILMRMKFTIIMVLLIKAWLLLLLQFVKGQLRCESVLHRGEKCIQHKIKDCCRVNS